MNAEQAALISGGMTTGSGIVGDILNYFNNRHINAQNIAFAREMNDLEYERYMQQWNRENAYNTPSMQMQRLVDAGLNPNLIYDSLSNANLGASPVPSASVPSSKPTDFNFASSVAAGTNQYLQGKLLQAQIKEMDSKTEMNYAEAHRIAKLTQPEYESMLANTARIRQVMQSESFRTKVEQIKAEMLDDENTFYYQDDGFYATYRDWFKEAEFTKLVCSRNEFKAALTKLYEEVGLIKKQSRQVELENKDLEEFVKVCAKIYNADAANADVVVQSAELTRKFQEDLGNAPQYVQLIVMMLDSLVNGVSKFTPRPRSKN